MRRWLAQFMQGRNGVDQLGRVMLYTSLGCMLVSLIFRNNTTVYSIFWYIALLLLVWCYFRMFSKKLDKRQAENRRFLSFKYKVNGWFGAKKERFRQRKTHRFFTCPQCGQTVRVPKGRGKIRIKCPKCSNTFIRKT